MSSLSTVEEKLPAGFRFHPRDEELIYDYLMKWISGIAHQTPFLIQVDLNNCEPWEIPETACVGGKEWYFYSQRDRKYATGQRTNRASASGYWKATGKDRPIIRKGALIGMRKTLVFYEGRAPKGKKTEWVMHEFRLEGNLGPGPNNMSSVKEDWVLCRVFYKSRSEVVSKQEAGGSSMSIHEDSSSSPSLPPLIEPYTSFHHDHHAQVSCFSNIFTPTQTTPNFSLLPTQQMDPTHPILPTKSNMPNLIGPNLDHLGSEINYNFNTNYNHNYDIFNNNINNSQSLNSPCSDYNHEKTKVINAVLSQYLTKMESGNHYINIDDHHNPSSSSFGDGSNSDSYLSDQVGLMSSVWN